jgi:hypothetical protein
MSNSRRNFLKAGIATATVAGVSATVGKLEAIPKAEAAIFGEPTLEDVYAQFGKYIHLCPGKFAGVVGAYDMSRGTCLAWMNFNISGGNKTAIPHHLAAFWSPDPYKEFEYIVDSQGGKNLYIYGVTTPVKDPAPGFNIWRVKYDGNKMEIQEDVAETTGLGLGVHVTVAPDNERFCVCDGQKDIMGIFRRGKGTNPSTVEKAVFFDWEPNNKELSRAWSDGGTLTVKHLSPPYDYKGTKGVKIDWELVPGGELFAEQGKVPGPRLKNLVAIDSLGWDPGHDEKYGICALRLLGAGIVFDTRTWEVKACCVGANAHKANNYQHPVEKVSDTEWKIVFPTVPTPAHQAGFSPTGNYFVLMNNAKENIMAVFDSSNQDDPTKWRRIAGVGDPSWRGAYPNPFHMSFTPDEKFMYVTTWWPPPTKSGIVVVDTKSWKIVKEHIIGLDTHTVACTNDGKWLFGVYSGFQKSECGTYVIRVSDNKFYGYLPSPLGHHDSVIVPSSKKDLSFSRCPTT